jgi:hypothetical protein
MTGHSLQNKLYAHEGERNDVLVQWDRKFGRKIKATGQRFDDRAVYSSDLKKKNLKTKKMSKKVGQVGRTVENG